jgi:FKBP-type peptidyl-prolyl cis-trans isomerase
VGVLGMKVGEKRKLTIPPQMGYGENSVGSIPPSSTLIFEVDMLQIN